MIKRPLDHNPDQMEMKSVFQMIRIRLGSHFPRNSQNGKKKKNLKKKREQHEKKAEE